MTEKASIPGELLSRRLSLGGIFSDLGLLIFSAVVFSLSFPGLVSEEGWGFLAYFSLIPVFLVASRAPWRLVCFYGAFYGFVSYALFNFWLAKFHPLAIIIVPTIYFTYLFLTFPFIKSATWLFPRKGYLLQPLIWLSYEYLRTKGFLGYSYGILGYSQYEYTRLIQIASVTGVWGLSLLVVFPSAYLAAAFSRGRVDFFKFLEQNKIPAFVYGLLFFGVLVFGFIAPVSTENLPKWRVALIQHNVDPWRGGFQTYRINLDRLKRLSDEALKENPKIVIWSETAFVPGIDWHTRYREDPDIYDLVYELRSYLRGQKLPFVVGNDDGRLEKDRDGVVKRIDYNASILFNGERIVAAYRKMHLVPFTENFPFEKELPGIYNWLKAADTHFWEPGKEPTVFEADGVKFSTPICFEDSFGYLSREFVKRGADVIVSMTNDSWSGSVAAAMQHLGMSVFRAVENRRSVVRATNGGMTCLIDPNGNVVSTFPAFKEGFLVGEAAINREVLTPYTKWGDWFASLCLGLSIFFLTAGLPFRLGFGKRIAIDNKR